MPLEIKGKLATVVFGTGDIAFASCEPKDDTHYFAFCQQAPGAIGDNTELGRESPIKVGWLPGENEPAIVFHFGRVEALDEVLMVLQRHRAERFPDAEQSIDRQRDDRIIETVRSIMSAGDMTVETTNEACLVKMMELRGTPIEYTRSFRDIDADWEREEAERGTKKS